MTVASILSKMQVLDNELDVSSGGADETRSITALDMAQDAFEAFIANHPDLLGTVGTVTTTANTETTAWPSTLMRMDTAWLINTSATPNLPQWELNIIQDVGGHIPPVPWPWGAGVWATPAGKGQPVGLYTNRSYLYWQPLPDAVYTVRIYGLYSKDELTSRAQTFQYPDVVSVPMASYAVRMMEMGIDDPSEELAALADELYAPVINMLRQPTRQRAQSRQYSTVHFT